VWGRTHNGLREVTIGNALPMGNDTRLPLRPRAAGINISLVTCDNLSDEGGEGVNLQRGVEHRPKDSIDCVYSTAVFHLNRGDGIW
jgi:hypothetical protein